MFNIEKIKEDLRPINIISYLNIPYKKSGNNLFIFCPDHESRTGKIDRHIGNCVLGKSFEDAYYCFGCGARGNCFELIAKLKKLDITVDFYEILSIAAEICGGENLFKVNNSFQPKKKERRDDMLSSKKFTKEQLSVIGLHQNAFSSIISEAFSQDLVKETDIFDKNVNLNNINEHGLSSVLYLSSKTSSFSLVNLADDDYEAYLTLIKNKSLEAMARYKYLALMDYLPLIQDLPVSIRKNGFAFSEKIKDKCKYLYLEAKNIYEDVSEHKINIDDSWIYNYE